MAFSVAFPALRPCVHLGPEGFSVFLLIVVGYIYGGGVVICGGWEGVVDGSHTLRPCPHFGSEGFSAFVCGVGGWGWGVDDGFESKIDIGAGDELGLDACFFLLVLW